MCGCRPLSVQGRAIVGLIALYALLLQAFLGALVPLGATPAFANAGLCAQDAPGAPTPAHQDCPTHACCIHAQIAALEAPPDTASSMPVRRGADQVASIRREGEADGARAPPERSVHPRGPPTL